MPHHFEDRRFDTFENCAPVVRCHELNIQRLTYRVSMLEKKIDTHGSPWWKRLLFRLAGVQYLYPTNTASDLLALFRKKRR